MLIKHLPAGLVAASLLLSGSASAQDRWETSFTFYLWAAETDNTITKPAGAIDVNLPFSDALENLEFAFMGALEARRNHLTMLGDYVYTNLAFSGATPDPAFSGTQADIKTHVVNAYALCRYLDVDHGPGTDRFEFSQSGRVLGIRYTL